MVRLKDNSEGKLRTFQKFKIEYCMETYLLDQCSKLTVHSAPGVHISAAVRTFFACVRPMCTHFFTQLSLLYTRGVHRKNPVRTVSRGAQNKTLISNTVDLPNLDHLTAVARLRMSAHRLAIETGRHVKPKICKEERICNCKNCALEEVEDESHFLLKCPLYCQQRTILMRTILSYNTSESQEELFVILMKSKETAVIKALGKYIYTAFKMREEHMSLL